MAYAYGWDGPSYGLLCITLALGCGTASPSLSEADGKASFLASERWRNQLDSGIVNLVSFRKTNGQAAEVMGVKWYQLEFEAILEYRNGLNPQCAAERKRGILFPSCSPLADAYDVGEEITVKGVIGFQMTEKGWRDESGNVVGHIARSAGSMPSKSSTSPTSGKSPASQEDAGSEADNRKLARLKTDIRQYMTSQEGFFTDSSTYGDAPSLQGTAYRVAFSNGAVIVASAADSQGYSVVVHNPTIQAGRRTCRVAVGSKAPSPSVDGVITCEATSSAASPGGVRADARRDPFAETELGAAARSGNAELITRLIAAGADVNAGYGYKKSLTALQAAAEIGSIDAVRALVGAGGQLEPARDTDGLTALGLAASKGHLDVVLFLVAKGAKMSGGGEYDPVPAMHAAAKEGRREVLRALLRAGADPTERHRGVTALELAREAGETDIVRILEVAQPK